MDAWLTTLLPDSLPLVPAVGPAAEGGADLLAVPGRMGIYLLTDADAHPVLLVAAGDMRASLRHRLQEIPTDQKHKRIPYRQFCAAVRWRRVDSPLLSDWYYWQCVRPLYPQTYLEQVRWSRPWWLRWDETLPHPILTLTNQPQRTGLHCGPFVTRAAAQRGLESLQDAFDLCRYDEILRQAPQGKPCAYKEMKKCFAPCDGSQALPEYQNLVRSAATFVADPGTARDQWRQQQHILMTQAAQALNFERAAMIKARLQRGQDLAHVLGTDVRTLSDLRWFCLLPGVGKRWVQPVLISGGYLECLPPVDKKNAATAIPQWLKACAALPTPLPPRGDPERYTLWLDQLALISYHQNRRHDVPGLWLPAQTLTQSALETALAEFFAPTPDLPPESPPEAPHG